jgi:hypothetical protein
MIRRVFGLICALALTGAGGYLSIGLLTTQGRVKVMFLLGAFMMLGVGLYWLWADYIHAEPKPES